MCIGKLFLSEFHLREMLLEGNYRMDKRVPLAALLVEYNNIMNIHIFPLFCIVIYRPAVIERPLCAVNGTQTGRRY
jgi:hypothetical protein